jgi:hypothetical protein
VSEVEQPARDTNMSTTYAEQPLGVASAFKRIEQFSH